MVTIVSAFFDINRDIKGDGRTIDEYKKWIKETLKLNCNLFIITEEKFRNLFETNNPNHFLKIINFKDSYYYKYYDEMKKILENDEYKKKITHPNRVECKLPEYNIIQYSKFHYLDIAIKENPFNSEYFFWLDVGASRFFYNLDLSIKFPNNMSLINNNKNKFFVQQRNDLQYYNINDNIVWDSVNLIYGTMFGGNKTIIEKISKIIEKIFTEKMLANNNVNNEQVALSLAWKNNPELFITFTNNYHQIFLLHLLQQL
jgi:hypothetical protein